MGLSDHNGNNVRSIINLAQRHRPPDPQDGGFG
ncbi:hypothetical protein FHW88_004980 [Mucilaginibacter sp. SG538B]|nr:hypothetical protein [Mucilaginibacter sp. SG538B]